MAAPLNDPHLESLRAALAGERAHQEGEHARKLRLVGPERVASGVSWPPLGSAAIAAYSGWRGWTVEARAAGPLHDGVGPGDPVTLRGADDRTLEGIVAEVDGAVAALQIGPWGPGGQPVEEAEVLSLIGGPIEVTLRFDPSTFERVEAALVRSDGHRSDLKRALLGQLAPAPPPEEGPGSAAGTLRGLDPSQRRAALWALEAEPLALIWGPPGTGKTWTLARTLRALVERGERPWALADSNAAVDNLALAASAAGLDVVRLGRPERMRPEVRPLSVDARVAGGLMGEALAAVEREMDAARSGPARGRGSKLRALYKERREILKRARRHAIEGAQVVASTLGTLARVGAELPPAKTALVDEATQAIEPAIWVAVPLVERLVLVGDPKQLGPVVLQPGNPLERSMMERLVETLPAPMLGTQRRMSAALQSLVAHTYGPDYRPHPSVADQRLVQIPGVEAAALTGRSLLWIDTAGAGLDEAQDPISRSLYNAGEIAILALAARGLLRAGVAPDDVGVIAPYSAQVHRLREALPGVEVATVNAFQGREKEVILCSFVRSNERGQLGFVADPRRLTVAASRARRLWIGVGDSATLGASPDFEALFEALQAAEAWATVWEPPWSEALGW